MKPALPYTLRISLLVGRIMADMEPPVSRLTFGLQHHFFGYYDKCPWDSTGRYVLALEIGFTDRPPAREDRAEVSMSDTQEDPSR
jgi:hypothetical protein